MSTAVTAMFLEAASKWLVDGGSLNIRFLASVQPSVTAVIDAILGFGPRVITRSEDFIVRAGSLLAGQHTFPSLQRTRALDFVRGAIAGEINFGDVALRLRGPDAHSHYSELVQRDRWVGELHLQVPGEAVQHGTSPLDLLQEDDGLRTSSPPFDGIAELAQALGLTDTRLSHQRPAITMRIGMPVDFVFSTEALSGDRLHVEFIAHQKCDFKAISVGVRAFPGKGLSTRRLINSLVKWRKVKDGFKTGALDVQLEQADSALLMLTYAGHTVRRQWFIDPEKATNARLVAVQTFDRDLKQLRQALLESTDSARFEQGVVALLFLLGFSATQVLETQAPDIVLVSPGGAIAIVECTTRIGDFAAKLGKLVDRRHLLVTQLQGSGHPVRVLAFLVTSQSRLQVAAEVSRLAALNVLLMTRESIANALSRTRVPGNPDVLLEEAARQVQAPVANDQ